MCTSVFSSPNWKILHLAKFFTQPAVVMVLTNMRCGHESNLQRVNDRINLIDSSHITKCAVGEFETLYGHSSQNSEILKWTLCDIVW